ncbi:MAG: tRNA epoxyqueuosine(34) reductase QueG [Rubripirellula sp.]|nr:tRNA epoxyqueuosine(34) reductase QueG [Rubripirellula sp.]
MSPDSLRQVLQDQARELGFEQFAVAPAVESAGYSNLLRWIDAGYAAEMDYFRNRQDAYRHPDSVLPGVRSIIVLTLPYAAATESLLEVGEGRIARYVWDHDDYHDIIHPKLKKLCRVIRESGTEASARGVVDTAPLMEREIAQLAGLGWRGKNTLLINKHQGSYFFLACVLTNLELPIDSPHSSSHCGTCTACLDACPTNAFPQAGVLDASRCISYLTIEHRESIPAELRDGIGDWLFGCDVCQQVCPWNRRPSRFAERPAMPLDRISLRELFDLDDETFRERFRKTPLWRARRRGILRNAAIVLGNSGDQQSRAALQKGCHDEEALIREACQWALQKLDS